MTISNYYIEIIDNSPSALQGLNMINRLLKEMKENMIINNLNLLGILRNRFDKRRNFTRQLNEVVEDSLELALFKTIIYDSVKYKEATLLNQTIQEYSPTHAKVYSDLIKEIKERMI